jgi:hypothetical protein
MQCTDANDFGQVLAVASDRERNGRDRACPIRGGWRQCSWRGCDGVAPWLRDAGANVELLTVIDASEIHETLTVRVDYPTEQRGIWEVGADRPAVQFPPPPPPKIWESSSQALEEVRAERIEFLEGLGSRY